MRVALFCIMAERTKHNAQRSLRFLAERHKMYGTLAKRLVDETTGHRRMYHVTQSMRRTFRNNMDLHIS